jgi:hypothetical protein
MKLAGLELEGKYFSPLVKIFSIIFPYKTNFIIGPFGFLLAIECGLFFELTGYIPNYQ